MSKTISVSQKLFSLKYSGIILISGGFLLVWDQVKRFQRNISSCTNPQILLGKAKKPEFIYIKDLHQEDILSKFEADGITNELYKITQLYFRLFGQFKGSELYENVLSFQQNLAWRYLKVCEDTVLDFRLRAIEALAKMQGLSDSTCVQIAQACDQRTAIGLARTQNVDLRLLRDPPGWRSPIDRKSLIRRLHEFLLAIVAESPHPCLQYVISRSFSDPDNKTFDDDVGYYKNQPDVISKCVEAILHHSWLGSNALSLVSLGGLPLLVDVYKEIKDQPGNMQTLSMLSRILSNISMHDSAHKDLFSSGCIKLLATMFKHEDIRVNMPAARALMNCDVDGFPSLSHRERFLRNVYSLHPTHRTFAKPKPKVDVVFIHGLLGGAFITWRQRDPPPPELKLARKDTNIFAKSAQWEYLEAHGVRMVDLPVDSNVKASDIFRKFRHVASKEEKRTQCWPRDWLANDCPGLRILGVNYDTNISMWVPMCPIAPTRQTLSDRSDHLAKVLSEAGVGCRPIVWVAHSMGGLIVKDLLVKCMSSEKDWQRKLIENTKGIIFFSTPHKGSKLAAMNLTSQMILWPSVEVMELRQNSPPLLELHKKFLNLIEKQDVEVISFAEKLPTYVSRLKMELRFVEDESSDADVGEYYGVPLDHLCICKPALKDSFLYQKVLQLVRQVLEGSTKEKM